MDIDDLDMMLEDEADTFAPLQPSPQPTGPNKRSSEAQLASAGFPVGHKKARFGGGGEDDEDEDDELLEMARMQSQDHQSQFLDEEEARVLGEKEDGGDGEDGEEGLDKDEVEALFGVEEVMRKWVRPVRSVLEVEGDSVMVSSRAQGETVYCALEADVGGGARELVAALQSDSAARGRALGLLAERPFEELLAEVEAERTERTIKASLEEQGARRVGGLAGGGDLGEELWVDEYSPSHYMELLSDELINREVLKWIKAWDPTVFPKSSAPSTSRAAPLRFGAAVSSAPKDTRPSPRVLLLAGPPGVGKTTLVHVLAKHCGYRPFEINASDDRSAGVLGQRIQDAVTMQSVMGARKPNLVVIDEIDGAAGGAEGKSGIRALLNIVNDGGSRAAAAASSGEAADGDAEDGENASGASKKRAAILQRPIICICNDPFVPALKPLRDVGRLFILKPPKPDKLLDRLTKVCQVEGVRAERAALMALMEKSGHDIRSCLNSLQLLSSRGGAVTLKQVRDMQMSSKDMERSAFRVWEEVFYIPNTKGVQKGSAKERMHAKLQVIGNFGDFELLMSGCHENMLSMRYHETGFSKTQRLTQWMADYDLVNKTIFKRSDYSFFAYLPFFAMAISASTAQKTRAQIRWPHAAMDARRKSLANRATLSHWVASFSPALQSGLGAGPALLELLPAMMAILAPSFKSLAPHLMSAADKAAMAQLVDTLISLGLTFATNTTFHDSSRSDKHLPPLSPPVESLVSFSCVKHPLSHALPEAFLRRVAHEVTLETIRRAGRAATAHEAESGPAAMETDAGADNVEAGAPVVSASSAALQVRLADRIKESAARNRQQADVDSAKAAASAGSWLDAMGKKSAKRKPTNAARSNACGSGSQPGGARVSQAAQGKYGPVLYKFHEGYTNAVKRLVRMSDLLH